MVDTGRNEMSANESIRAGTADEETAEQQPKVARSHTQPEGIKGRGERIHTCSPHFHRLRFIAKWSQSNIRRTITHQDGDWRNCQKCYTSDHQDGSPPAEALDD